MTTPTAGAVPSNLPQNLLFNAEKMDEAVNSPAPTFEDRLGETRQTWAGIEADLGAAYAVTETGANRLAVEAAATEVLAAATAIAALPALSTAAATIAIGRAAVANGASFWVKPNPTDGLTRYTAFTRISSTDQTYVTSLTDAGEFDAALRRSQSSGMVIADPGRQIGQQVDGDGKLSAPAIEIGEPLYPLAAPSISAPMVMRNELGERKTEFGPRSRMVDLEVERLHGQDYSRHKPVRDLRVVVQECYAPVIPSRIAGRPLNCMKVEQFNKTARNPRFAFTNTFGIREAGGDVGLGQITVRLSALHQGRIYQMTVAGQSTVVMAAGTTVIFDPLYIEVPGGTNLPLKMFVQPEAGKFIPMGTPYFAANGDGVSYTAGEVDQTGNADFVYPAWDEAAFGDLGGPIAFGPIAVVGQAYDADPVVAFVGNSIDYGFGAAASTGTHFGYAHEVFAGQGFCLLNLSQPGETASVVESSIATYNRWRWLDYADYGVVGAPPNDIAQGRTLYQVQTNLIRIWQRLRASGLPAVQNTCTPVATSTDGFATLANQARHSMFPPGGVREQFNDWIRAGAPIVNGIPVAIGTAGALLTGDVRHPLSGYFEMADAVESSRNSGLWKPNYTGDGTHPLELGHRAMALVAQQNNFL